jgi:hypothetical protein
VMMACGSVAAATAEPHVHGRRQRPERAPRGPARGFHEPSLTATDLYDSTVMLYS